MASSSEIFIPCIASADPNQFRCRWPAIVLFISYSRKDSKTAG